jgi:hypothetical protein
MLHYNSLVVGFNWWCLKKKAQRVTAPCPPEPSDYIFLMLLETGTYPIPQRVCLTFLQFLKTTDDGQIDEANNLKCDIPL